MTKTSKKSRRNWTHQVRLSVSSGLISAALEQILKREYCRPTFPANYWQNRRDWLMATTMTHRAWAEMGRRHRHIYGANRDILPSLRDWLLWRDTQQSGPVNLSQMDNFFSSEIELKLREYYVCRLCAVNSIIASSTFIKETSSFHSVLELVSHSVKSFVSNQRVDSSKFFFISWRRRGAIHIICIWTCWIE